MNLRWKILRSWPEWRDLQPVWETLAAQGGYYFFQSWHWNALWGERFLASGGRDSLRGSVLEDGAGRIWAILPLFHQPLAGSWGSLVQFFGPRLSFHNDSILREPHNPDLAEAVAAALPSQGTSGSVLLLRHLHEDSPLTRQLLAQGLARFQCARVVLEADPGLPDHHKRLKSSARRKYRWRENKLRRERGYAVRVFTGADFEAAFEQFIDLHRLRFASLRRPSLLQGESLAFFREASRQLALQGKCEAVQLVSEENVLASAITVHDQQRYFNLNFGFDPQFGQYGPAKILIFETIRRAFDELGCQTYDFGPGYETFKYEWQPRVSSNYFCCLGAGLRGRVLANLCGKAFQKKLPPSPVPAGKVT